MNSQLEQEKMNEDDKGWHLDKRVPISIIITLLIYGISGLWFLADLKKDVEILKMSKSTSEQAQSSRDQRQDQTASENHALFRAELTYIRGQLDVLIRDIRKRTQQQQQ